MLVVLMPQPLLRIRSLKKAPRRIIEISGKGVKVIGVLSTQKRSS